MVRLSTTEPIEKSPFTLSKVNKKGAVDHQRIYATAGGSTYYTHIKYKSGTNKIEGQDLEILMKRVKSELKLKLECPGSKYLSKSKVGSYLPSPEDESDD